MAEDIRRVTAGDPIKSALTAGAWNTMRETARDYLQRKLSKPPGPPVASAARDAGIVLVKNGTGAAVARGGVLSLGTPLVLPSDSQDGFLNRVILNGSTPAVPGDAGYFAVLQQPAADGAIVSAVASGIVQVQLDVIDEADQWADVADGDTAKLKTGAEGAAFIIWKESGTGTKWGVVKIGNPDLWTGSKYMVRQIIDDNGTHGVDWVRAHD